MTRRIAVMNDLSGMGRCSLTAAISVIAAMGVQPCPVPTAVLSAQTGFESYYYDDYTDRMDPYRKEWEKMGATFDGIYTGFLAHSRQAEKALSFLDSFQGKNTFLLVDPIMGDEGVRFDFFEEKLLDYLKVLVSRADIITPNLTELCLLTDVDYRLVDEIADSRKRIRVIGEIGQELIAGGTARAVVTGVRFLDAEDGTEKIGNVIVSGKDVLLSAYPFVGRSYSGTGDLFASVIAGGEARGDRIEDSVETAGRMIALAIRDAEEENVRRNEGVNYEKYLYMLLPKTQKNEQ